MSAETLLPSPRRPRGGRGGGSWGEHWIDAGRVGWRGMEPRSGIHPIHTGTGPHWQPLRRPKASIVLSRSESTSSALDSMRGTIPTGPSSLDSGSTRVRLRRRRPKLVFPAAALPQVDVSGWSSGTRAA